MELKRHSCLKIVFNRLVVFCYCFNIIILYYSAWKIPDKNQNSINAVTWAGNSFMLGMISWYSMISHADLTTSMNTQNKASNIVFERVYHREWYVIPCWKIKPLKIAKNYDFSRYILTTIYMNYISSRDIRKINENMPIFAWRSRMILNSFWSCFSHWRTPSFDFRMEVSMAFSRLKSSRE